MTSDPFPSPEAIEAAASIWRNRLPVADFGLFIVPTTVRSLDAAVKAQPVVALPLCPTCKGAGEVQYSTTPNIDPRDPACETREDPCGECGGSGVDRLIPESEIREWIAANSGEHLPGALWLAGHRAALRQLSAWLDEWEARQ